MALLTRDVQCEKSKPFYMSRLREVKGKLEAKEKDNVDKKCWDVVTLSINVLWRHSLMMTLCHLRRGERGEEEYDGKCATSCSH